MLTGRAVAAWLAAATLLAGGPVAAERPPNIVLVVTDDGPRQEELAYLPRLREMLFDSGVTFASFLTPNPVCCPSRVSTLRGQYCHNTGVVRNAGFWIAYREGLESEMLPVWLSRAGYATALFGKYLNGYLQRKSPVADWYVPPGWTEWYGGKPRNGYGVTFNVNGRVVEYTPEGPHANDLLGRFAVDFIRRRVPDGPVFLMISTGAPHKPARPARRHRDRFLREKPPQRPSFNEWDVSDKPAWVRALAPVPADEPRRLRSFRNRLRSLLSVEDLLADVLAELEARGELGRTYVFFFADNGWHYGEHRIARAKGSAYEESILVTAAARGPGVPAGQSRAHLVANHDLAPTFLALAGAPAPEFLDGRSLLPLLSASPPPVEDWRQAVSLRHSDTGQSPDFTGLRLQTMKYVLYGTGEEELYDLAADPFELRSRHRSPDWARRLQQLRAWNDALGACAAETCRSLEMRWP